MKTKTKNYRQQTPQEWWSEGESNPIGKMTSLPSRPLDLAPHPPKKFYTKKPLSQVVLMGRGLADEYRQRRQASHFASQFIETVFFCQIKTGDNPTGLNLSLKQIENLIEILRDREIFVFVDFAYLGLGNDLDSDCQNLRFLWENLDDIAFGASFSKNASLYKHHTGAVFVKTNRKKIVQSQLQNLIRSDISNPPAFGSDILINIFENNFEQWKKELNAIKNSLNQRREKLCQKVGSKFDYLRRERGLFGMLPLSPQQISKLKKNSIYLPESGRINFGGIPENKIDFLAEKFGEILE